VASKPTDSEIRDGRPRYIGAVLDASRSAVSGTVPVPARIVRWNLTARRQEYASADAVVVSPGKAGRTWLRVALHKYLSLHFGVPFDVDRLDSSGGDVPRLVYTHERLTHLNEPPGRRLLGAEVLPDGVAARVKLVVLARDPRDVIVSSYFQKTKRSKVVDCTLSEFIRHPRFGIHRTVRVLNQWRRRFHAHPHCLWLRYEDMIEDQERELRRVLAHLGVEAQADLVIDSIQFASFENMRENEARDAFGTRRLRSADPADPDAFKVRRGKVGGYREYLDRRDLRYVDKELAKLDGFYGYSLRALSPTPDAPLEWPPGSYFPDDVAGKSVLVIGRGAAEIADQATLEGAERVDVGAGGADIARTYDIILCLDPPDDPHTAEGIRRIGAHCGELLVVESPEDPAQLRPLLAERTALFSRLESHPSPRTRHRLLVARRRKIGRLVVIAGPTAAGKSTLIEKLRRGEARIVGQRLSIQDWAKLPVVEFRQFKDLTDPHVETLVYHRNILRPHLNADGSYESDEALDLLDAAARISIVTLWCSPAQLRRQLRQRIGRRVTPGSAARARKLPILENYKQPERVRGHYRAWFDYIAGVAADRFVLTTADGEEIFSEEEWKRSGRGGSSSDQI
jgi:hypothetical protein